MINLPRSRYRDIQFPEFRSYRSRLQIGWRRGTGGMERRRTKLVRRTRNGSSPYFCDSSRPVHPSGSGSHYRSMDGRGGKGEKGSSSVRAPRVPRSPFLSFSFLASLHPPLSPLSSDPVSLILSRGSPRFLPLSRFRYLLPPPPFPGFRYLIKSSYDEKDEDSARSGRIRRSFSVPFYGPLKRPCSREKNWGMIMRGR